VIEVAANQPLDEYLASAIFEPLGMVDSGYYVPPEKAERLAAVYESKDGLLHRLDSSEANQVTEHVLLLSGGGGLVSTVPDYVRFTRMLLRRGELDGVRLIKPETVELMTRNHLAAPLYPLRFGDYALEGEGYGLGVGVIVEPPAADLAGSAGTYEWAGSWNTDFWIDPVKELTGIFMSQLEPRASKSAGREYWSLVCQALTD
jgi:CubicO group peptidase (beta-lactamase class C family)